MTSSSDTFPFGIADVVELLGLTVRRRLPSSLYLNCPFCGDLRGRLNVNTDKNVWRCNRCGAAGGMLALYARYNCTGNADAYREICEALGRYTPRPRVNDCIGVKPEQNARAAPQEIHQTYSLLLSMLPLTPTHKAHLLSPRRGLTEEQIARFGFKSTPPAFLCRSYAERLRRQGCTLQDVPGFYTDNAGRWTINFGSRTAGILLPAVGMDGLICGMQIRLDTSLRRRDDPPGKSGAKYVVLAVKRKRQAYIKKKIRDKENQTKREEEQSNFGAEENTVWDRLEVQNEELVAAVQQLKPKARFIVTGYVLKGKTFKELAQETKLTERAAASTYYRSIEKLRIKMEKEK